MSSLSVIIPALNEAGTIERLINSIFSVTPRHHFTAEVIVVDHGSQDGTREIVADLSSRLPVTLICTDQRQGPARAVVEGARAARHDSVIVMDGDLSHSPEYIPQLANPILDGSFDVVIGSRYTAGGSTPDWPWKRKTFSQLASFPAQTLTGADDPLSGFFAVARKRLLTVNPEAPGYKICLELLLGKRENMNIIEIPICLRDRQTGTPKMSMSVATSFFSQLVRLCSLSVPCAFPTTIISLICAGFVSDMIIYSAGISLKATLFYAHLTALIGSVIVMLFTHHFLLSGGTVKAKILYQPAFWLLLALLLTFRFGLYVFALNVSGGSPLLSTALAMACSAVAVTLFISKQYFRP